MSTPHLPIRDGVRDDAPEPGRCAPRTLAPIPASLPATVPFVGPESQERARGRRFAARIGANESAFGPSPQAVEAMASAARDAWMYGDPEMFELREAIAGHHGVAPSNVMIGEGIDGLLGTLCRLMLAPGDAAVTGLGSYPTFAYHVAGAGAALHAAPYRDDAPDLAALGHEARRRRAKLVYLANPDNPMGGLHRPEAVAALLDALPETALLVLDEAYADCTDGNLLSLDMDDPRLLRFRTFSKAHGLAGLRVGYVLGATEAITAFNKMRNHFGVGRVAQAGALAALQDQAYHAETRSKITAARMKIAEIASAHGLVALPSHTNFVTIDAGRDGAFARALLEALLKQDVFVRMPGAAPLDRCIRVSCGSASALEVFDAALGPALTAARGGAAS